MFEKTREVPDDIPQADWMQLVGEPLSAHELAKLQAMLDDMFSKTAAALEAADAGSDVLAELDEAKRAWALDIAKRDELFAEVKQLRADLENENRERVLAQRAREAEAHQRREAHAAQIATAARLELVTKARDEATARFEKLMVEAKAHAASAEHQQQRVAELEILIAGNPKYTFVDKATGNKEPTPLALSEVARLLRAAAVLVAEVALGPGAAQQMLDRVGQARAEAPADSAARMPRDEEAIRRAMAIVANMPRGPERDAALLLADEIKELWKSAADDAAMGRSFAHRFAPEYVAEIERLRNEQR